MHVIASFTIVPVGVGVSLSRYVAACAPILEAAGLSHTLHANGTNVEGEWEAVFEALRRCHEAVHEMGAPRIATILKISTRTDREVSRDGAVRSVEEKLEAGE